MQEGIKGTLSIDNGLGILLNLDLVVQEVRDDRDIAFECVTLFFQVLPFVQPELQRRKQPRPGTRSTGSTAGSF